MLAFLVAGLCVGINAQEISLASPLDYEVIQRFNHERGSVRIAGTVKSGTPGSIEIRIDSAGHEGQWKNWSASS
jgi:hypothetical protein